MIFCIGNCRKKARWKKRNHSAALTKILIPVLSLIILIGLLFLCPRWLLIIFIIILGISVCLLLLK